MAWDKTLVNTLSNYQTLKELLLCVAARHPSRGHYFYPNGIDDHHIFLSYAALVQRAERLARQLVSAGLAPGTIALLYVRP
jgi:non-ribosomal peptide synthetase component E (peptide arylation enzyme)